MAIHPSGTFDYVAIVPELVEDQAPWKVRLRTPIQLTGDDRSNTRLVGHSPTLEISDAGMTPSAQTSRLTGKVSPRVLRSRLTLTAATRNDAGVASVSFHVDRALTMALCPHEVHGADGLRRTGPVDYPQWSTCCGHWGSVGRAAR